MNVTMGHSSYPLKCMLTPNVRGNAGCYTPLEITAPPEVAALLAKAPFKERLERTSGKEVAVKENPAFTRETYTILSV